MTEPPPRRSLLIKPQTAGDLDPGDVHRSAADGKRRPLPLRSSVAVGVPREVRVFPIEKTPTHVPDTSRLVPFGAASIAA